MNTYKLIARLALSLLALCALAACGSPPVAFSSIPLPPDATRLQPGTNPLADSIANGFSQSMGKEGGTIEVYLYNLPAETQWDDVKAFYDGQIKDDWKAETQLAQDIEAFKAVGWTRGSFASEQGLVVGYSPGFLDAPPFMMVALFSE
jgi:hypothetical protein